MSFLKISDPAKRDAMVKEYLELKKNIRDNLLSERTGELELQADLSKFYKPITETQKATAREITEGLKPIREGIEKLPEAITFPTTQPTEEEEEEEEEEKEDEEKKKLGDIAYKYLNRPNPDENFGVRKEKDHHYIGDKHVIIKGNNIIIREDGTEFIGTPGLWELITSKHPVLKHIDREDIIQYSKLMLDTNSIYKNNDPTQNRAKGNHLGDKWEYILNPIWGEAKRRKSKAIPQPWPKGEGVVVIPSDPNALLERLDLLLASQDAGHTGVGNELVSISLYGNSVR